MYCKCREMSIPGGIKCISGRFRTMRAIIIFGMLLITACRFFLLEYELLPHSWIVLDKLIYQMVKTRRNNVKKSLKRCKNTV